MSYFTSSRSGRGRKRKKKEFEGGPWAQFKHDLRDAAERHYKRTSAAHKRFAFLLIVGGALLRIWCATLPITPEEAIAYMAFATGDLGDAISNYALPSNHVFHTVLMRWSTGLFGMNMIAMRLPALLASVLVLPLFYLLVRSLFNRYIALMALAMACAFPPMIELSALATGYSITWLCWIAALVLGRHLVRENNLVSAVLLGIVCAFGMWAVPSMLPMALMVFLWVMFSVLTKYERSVGERMGRLGLAVVLFTVLTVLLYLPVIFSHGLDQLFHHATEQQYSWTNFGRTYADRVFDLWVWIIDATYWWVAVLGFIGLTQAAYISAKYRTIVFATVLSAVPITLAKADVGDPYQWSYLLFVFHIGSSIALFYLLKFVQDKLIKNFGTRGRTAGAAAVLFVGFVLPGMSVVQERVPHLPEARAAAEFLSVAMAPADRLCMDPYWEASIAFHLKVLERDAIELRGYPRPGGTQYGVVAEPNGQPLPIVLLRCAQEMDDYEKPVLVKDWERMGIFAARLRNGGATLPPIPEQQ